MNPVNNTSSLPLLTTPVVIENLEASSDAMKSEIHRKKSDKVDPEALSKIGSGMGTPLSESVTVTSYSLPVVSSNQAPDIAMAKEYLEGISFDQAMDKMPPGATFTIQLFARAYEFFIIMRDTNNAARASVNSAGSALSKMRESINDGLKEQIVHKGREAMAMSITGAVVGAAVAGVGTGSLMKNTSTSRTDLKNNHKTLPVEQSVLRSKQSDLGKLDLNNPGDKAKAKTLKTEIAAKKEGIANIEHKSHLVQNRAESNYAKGMAIQTMGQSVTAVFEGINQATQATNEAAVVGSQASQEVLAELAQKTLDAANEQRDALLQALTGMQEMAALQADVYSAISGNLK